MHNINFLARPQTEKIELEIFYFQIKILLCPKHLGQKIYIARCQALHIAVAITLFMAILSNLRDLTPKNCKKVKVVCVATLMVPSGVQHTRLDFLAFCKNVNIVCTMPI